MEGYGTAFMDGFTIAPDGSSIQAFTGTITVVSAESMIGHKVNARDSNWAVLISGEKSKMYILGCKLARVLLHDRDLRHAQAYLLP